MLKLAAMHPTSSLVFGYPQKQGSFVILMLKDTETGSESKIFPNEVFGK